MKTLFNMKRLVVLILFAVAVIPLNSCHKNNDQENSNQDKSTISGKWEFVVSPKESYQDTTTIHGAAATDYKEGSSSYDEVYLYEDKENNIYGELWGYKIIGTRNGNSVQLNFYEFPDGPFNENTALENMILFTQMELTVNEFGLMNGSGSYSEQPDQEWTKVDTYFINANKLNDITNPNLKSSFKHILCDLASTFSSFMISGLTKGIFRPMANCYGHKSGGGYYAFGHEGPGSILPIYTQTFYMAWEWSWCKVRKYDFNIDLKGESIGYEALKDLIREEEPILQVLDKLGMSSFESVEEQFDVFYRLYGGFAISIAYDTHTHNISLYVNHEKGSSYDAAHSDLVLAIRDGLDHFCHHVYVYAGKNIHDSFHMRRSHTGLCNSDIIIFYLFGTNNVNYD